MACSRAAYERQGLDLGPRQTAGVCDRKGQCFGSRGDDQGYRGRRCRGVLPRNQTELRKVLATYGRTHKAPRVGDASVPLSVLDNQRFFYEVRARCRTFCFKSFSVRKAFVHALLLLRSVMVLRAAITALLFLAAFDHYIGDDKGATFIAAIIRHLFH